MRLEIIYNIEMPVSFPKQAVKPEKNLLKSLLQNELQSQLAKLVVPK